MWNETQISAKQKKKTQRRFFIFLKYFLCLFAKLNGEERKTERENRVEDMIKRILLFMEVVCEFNIKKKSLSKNFSDTRKFDNKSLHMKNLSHNSQNSKRFIIKTAKFRVTRTTEVPVMTQKASLISLDSAEQKTK